jgi:hypothetical protein
MALSSIKSITTYHKCIVNFVSLGIIKYFPSYHPKLGSEIHILGNRG